MGYTEVDSTYKTETVLSEDGKLVLSQIPFRAGERIEVTIRAENHAPPGDNPYPLRGKPIKFFRPTDPVGEDDWESAQ